MAKNKIKICYFPGRESSYVRNRALIKGMQEAGLYVLDCSCPKKNISRYFYGFIKFLRFKGKSDFVFVGFFGQFLVPIVKLFTRQKIIFDAFLSAYQTLAFDRKSITPNGWKAKFVRFIEKKSCSMADVVLLDTNQHINYFVNEYHISESKFQRNFLSSDNAVLKAPETGRSENFIVQFHGEFQALHGTQYILQAAKLLPNINFRMIGGGRELDECLLLARTLNLTNVEFIPPVPCTEIPRYIAEATICLGIFGETQKTQLVIPFKVYEELAMQKPIITADTPAIRELLTHTENVYLCKAADPQSIADAITALYQDPELREKIARNGYQTFHAKASPAVIGRQILKTAEKILKA